MILHVRKAHDETLALLRRHAPARGGIAHAFNGSLQQARAYLELGFRLGFGGMLTYARSRRLRRLAAALPAAAIVLETDAPWQSPVEQHGERNSPAYLPQCLSALAAVRVEARERLAEQTTRNACAVLSIEVPGRESRLGGEAP